MNKIIDITGEVFGELTANNLLPERDKHGGKVWACSCSCGNNYNVLQNALRTGNTVRCRNHPKNLHVTLGEDHYIDVSTKQKPNTLTRVDADDVERILKRSRNLKWSVTDSHPEHEWGVYVQDSNRKKRLHRFIINCSAGMFVDHINGDTLDNRKCNLREVTAAENCKNVRMRVTNRSGVTGVYLEKHSGLYVAEITCDGKKHFLGRYDHISHANVAYDVAKKLLGFTERHGVRR